MTERIIFLDKDGKLSDKEHAVSFVATEYDGEGNTVHEVFGDLG